MHCNLCHSDVISKFAAKMNFMFKRVTVVHYFYFAVELTLLHSELPKLNSFGHSGCSMVKQKCFLVCCISVQLSLYMYMFCTM